MSYKYSQEAKERVSKLGAAEVAEFIEEVPQNLRKIVYDRLPRVQGFRSGSQAELKEKQKRLVAHLTHPGASQELDWKSFALLWEAWARERLGEAFPKGDDYEPTLDSALVFLKNLTDLFPEAAREDIDRLFMFGGFPNHPDCAAVLACFRTAKSLSRDRIIEGLPSRLGKIEDRFNFSEVVVEDVVERVEQLEITTASKSKDDEEIAKQIKKNSSAIMEVQAKLSAESVRLDVVEKIVDTLGSASKKIDQKISEADVKTNALDKSLRGLAARGDGWDEILTEVAALKEAIIGLAVREAEWASATESVNDLGERLVALEGILAAGGMVSETKQLLRLLENVPDGPFVDILSVEDACDIVASNLQAISIVKGESIALARQAVAAFVAGQMVQFSGSLADLAADAVAAAIGGPSYHEWRVPVGLISGEVAADCVEIVTESSGCLLLRGANLSAFEVYGAAVREIIQHRQFTESNYGRLALISSWAQGPAAFPDGGTLAELGPVFDTDALRVRGVAAKLPALKYGRLIKEKWGEVEGLNKDESMLALDEFREMLEETGFEGGNLWRRVATRAYLVLRAMPGGSPEGDLHSLIISWTVPWAKAMAGPTDEMTSIVQELVERRAETGV